MIIEFELMKIWLDGALKSDWKLNPTLFLTCKTVTINKVLMRLLAIKYAITICDQVSVTSTETKLWFCSFIFLASGTHITKNNSNLRQHFDQLGIETFYELASLISKFHSNFLKPSGAAKLIHFRVRFGRRRATGAISRQSTLYWRTWLKSILFWSTSSAHSRQSIKI